MSIRTRANAMIRVFGVLVVLCWLSSLAPAQTVNGSFHGTVVDTSGGVIPGVDVKVRNLAVDLVRQGVTDAVGFYAIPQLPPGRYSFIVSKSGFKTAQQPDVLLLVNEDREVNFNLEVGATSQVVEVRAAPTALETTSGTLGQVIGAQQVVDLPLNGRQFTQMILLAPGAVPHEENQQAVFIIPIGGGGISPSVSGAGGRQNNFTLDGNLNNNPWTNDYDISPPPDAIQEFKLQTHITDAGGAGIGSGANVNVVTKQGSNQVHGDVWEFVRNDKFDAANFFDNFSNVPKPPFRLNQFGFTVGGPVVLPKPGGAYDGRNKKTYFFGYYEGVREDQPATGFGSFPTAAELGGDFSDLLTSTQAGVDPLGRPVMQGAMYNPYSTRQVTAGAVDPETGLVAQSTGLVRDAFPNNQIPSTMLNPQALTMIKAFFPLPNYGTGGLPNYVKSTPTIIDSDQFGVRLDHTFRNNDTLMGAFYLTNPKEDAVGLQLLGDSILTNHARQLSLSYTHLFSPTLLLTLHFGYRNAYWYDGPTTGGVSLLQATNQQAFEPVKANIPQVPIISLAPRYGGTNQFATVLGPNRGDSLTADVQKVRGSHTFSAGALFYKIRSYDDGWGAEYQFDQYPSSAIIPGGSNAVPNTGDGLASMLLNLPSTLVGLEGLTQADFHSFWQGYYLQDKWQATRKLSIQAGLRYDFVAPPQWKNNQEAGWSANCGCYLIGQPFGSLFPYANVRPGYFDPQYRGFQPRIGLAYSLTPKTVMRTGAGIFQDHDSNFLQEAQDMRADWPWAANFTIINLNRGVPSTFFSSPPPLSSFIPSPTNATVPVYVVGVDNRNKIPTSYEWNFGIQRQFTPSFTAEVAYVGMKNTHAQMTNLQNTVLPNEMGPGPFQFTDRVPYPQFATPISYELNVGYGNYNSLQVKAEKRFSEGLTFLSAYTWSHCLDVGSDPYSSNNAQNPYDINADYSNCDQDFRHVFSFSYVYQLPFGRGKRFGSGWNRWVNGVLGGWQMSGIESAQSGSPFTVELGFDNSNTGVGADRPNLIGNPVPPGFVQNRDHWFNAAAFAIPTPYTYGNSGYSILFGPAHNSFDFGLMKDFKFTELKYLQFRAEAFNIANEVNFANPGGGVSPGYSNLGGTSTVSYIAPNFNQIFGAGPARILQFSLKLVF